MVEKAKAPRIRKAATDRVPPTSTNSSKDVGGVPLERAVTAEQLRAPTGHFTDDVSQDADGKTEAVTHHVKVLAKVVYVVNPGGAVHDVSEERSRELLRIVGWRQATPAEIAELKKRGGHQTADDPIAKPFDAAVNG